MDNLPQRVLLSDQAATALRRGLSSARWEKQLPSESKLCQELQISRMTLRKALGQLVREGWIEPGGRGRRHRILSEHAETPVSSARTIRVLTPFKFPMMSSVAHALFETLSIVISAAGYRLEYEFHPKLFRKFQSADLARLDSQPDTAAWVPFYSTETIQRWFASCGRPTVVAGRVYNSIPLSSIFSDSLAMARHAAGLLWSRGHREVAYLIANVTSLNDRLAAEEFVAEASRLGARARIVSYEAATDSADRAVKDLMMSRPRVTAYVTGASELAITVLCYLQAAGIRVPSEASVISLWDDYTLSCTYPKIARYHTDGKVIGRQIGKTLLDLFRHGTGRIRTVSLMPKFIDGGTLGPGPHPGKQIPG